MNFIYDLCRRMIGEDLILVYYGEFTQETTRSILTIAERGLEAAEEDTTIKRKVFNVMVESLQNIVKHNDKAIGTSGSQRAIFLVGREASRYTIMSGNPLHKNKVGPLKETLNRLNALDKEGLKDLHKNIIKDATLSEKGGAGLGFVDMARKSGDKLVFDFPEISHDHCFFCLTVKISREPNSLN